MTSRQLSFVAALAAAGAVVLAVGAASAAGPKHKLKPSVEFARTWDAAVAEAKLLNVPIVVHDHGFYCGPCWGMHAAVLQNADYIKFASANTVEVISLSRLDEGVKEEHARAAKYEATVDGRKVECMVEWPNLTYDEMVALNASPGGHYNDTGGVPFTAVVNPHDLKEMWRHGGGTSSGAIIDAVKDAKKALEKEHGKGIARKEYSGLVEAEASAKKLSGEGEFAKAISALDGATKGAADWPEALRDRIEKARATVVEAAKTKLDEIESQAATDPAAAKRALDKLMPRLKGTGLETDAKEVATTLAAG